VNEKSNRTNISIEKLCQHEYYRNILRLLLDFQDKENGLRHMHFIHALMENEKDLLSEESIESMNKFFDNSSLQYLYSMGSIRKGSVTTRKNLTYYLRYLLRNNVIVRDAREKHFRYKLSKKFGVELVKWSTNLLVGHWTHDFLFDNDSFFKYYPPMVEIDRKEIGEWFIFGLPLRMNEMFDEVETIEIAIRLKNVEENLWRIAEMKHSKIKEMKEKVNARGNAEISPSCLDLLKMDENRLDFFYSSPGF